MATELSFLSLWSDSFHHFWNLLWLVPPSQGKFHARPRGAQLCNVPSWLTSPVRTNDIFLLSCCTASITGHRLLFGLFPWSSGQEKQGRKFNGQIVYRSKGVRGVGQRQHRGNKWKRGRTLVPPCCVYCGHSVCPACRAAPKACWSSSHVPLTFYLLPLGPPKLPFNCHPLELFVINLKGTQTEFWHPGSRSPFDFVF